MEFIPPMYEPFPTMYLSNTFPEKSHRPHHFPFPWWRNKIGRLVHDPDMDTHIPVTDVRETQSGYFIDLELPGFSDKSKLSIRWTSTRSLLVQVRIERPHLPDCQHALGDDKAVSGATESGQAAADGQTGSVATTAPLCSCSGVHHDTLGIQPTAPPADVASTKEGESATSAPGPDSGAKEAATHLTVSERPIGYFARNFSFPVDVEYGAMKATLEHGLLKLRVAKKVGEKVLDGKEHVAVE